MNTFVILPDKKLKMFARRNQYVRLHVRSHALTTRSHTY
jgi:hypothetical protein